MPDILITQPFHLEMELLDIVESHPSFQMNIHLKNIYFQGSVSLETEKWFRCCDWDTFLAALIQMRTPGAAKAVLKDMSDEWQLTVVQAGHSLVLELNTTLHDSGLQERLAMHFKVPVDDDVYSHFYRSLAAFPRWW